MTIGRPEENNTNLTFSRGKSGTPPIHRRGKGRSLLTALEDYTVMDIETTGLSPRYDDIIEVAALRVTGGIVTNQFASLINPGTEISGFITNLTGITNGMLAVAPGKHDVLPRFLEFLGESVLVAHNAHFDINFLYDHGAALPMPHILINDFIDTMRLSRRLFPEHRRHRLEDVASRFQVANAIQHRALADCHDTYQCYEHLKKHGRERHIDFATLYPKNGKSWGPTVKAADIRATVSDIDEDTEIFGKTFVFTGMLQRMTRKQAMQAVVNMGGCCADRVTQTTDYLVLGNNDYRNSTAGRKTSKHVKAEHYKLAGHDIGIIAEDQFYEMIENE